VGGALPLGNGGHGNGERLRDSWASESAGGAREASGSKRELGRSVEKLERLVWRSRGTGARSGDGGGELTHGCHA